jgi:hypothetical protein
MVLIVAIRYLEKEIAHTHAVKCQVVRRDATGYCRVSDANEMFRSKRQVQIACVKSTKK